MQTAFGSARRVAAFLFGGFLCLYLFTASVNAPFCNDSGTLLRVSARIWTHGFEPIEGRAEEENADTYSLHGLGQPLIDLPVAWAYEGAELAKKQSTRGFYALAVSVLSSALGAAINVLVFVCACLMGYRLRVAFYLALLSGFTTMVWVYAQALYGDSSLGLCYLAALACTLSYRRSPSLRWLAGCNAALGLAILVKPSAVIALPVFAVVWLRQLLADGSLRARLPAIAVAALAPLAVFYAMGQYYTWVRYGTIWATGYQHGGHFPFSTPLTVGLFGLLLSSGKGYFFYNPGALLSLIGLRRALRRDVDANGCVLGLFVLTLLLHARWCGWSGDYAWGPRFMAAVVPTTTLLAAPVIERLVNAIEARRGQWRARLAGAIGILLLGATVQLSGLLIEGTSYLDVVSGRTASLGVPGEQPWLRDHQVVMHFVPEYSPLIGHWWMLRCLAAQGDPAAFAQAVADPPWIGLAPDRVPEQGHVLEHLAPSMWWFYYLQRGIPGAKGLAVLALVIALLSALLLREAGASATRERGAPSA